MAIVGWAKYTRTRAKFRGDATRGERQNFRILALYKYFIIIIIVIIIIILRWFLLLKNFCR